MYFCIDFQVKSRNRHNFEKQKMKIISNTDEFRSEIQLIKANSLSIGFVPTMGALHDGHIALVNRAVQENDVCIVSIFVNPTQFNNLSDLEKYPRNLELDAQKLEKTGCKLVFSPRAEDIYTVDDMQTRFEYDFEGLDRVMEGKFRPGHFNGVVQIVSKLFGYVQPDRAYFGEKDFQQLAIIHHMVKTMKLNVQIVDCPIVRELSGLALSSRNERLSADEKKIAAGISKVLFESRNFVPAMTPAEVTEYVLSGINKIQGIRAEYFEIVNAFTLQPAENWMLPAIGCIAAFCGDVCLIDNIRYQVSQ